MRFEAGDTDLISRLSSDNYTLLPATTAARLRN